MTTRRKTRPKRAARAEGKTRPAETPADGLPAMLRGMRLVLVPSAADAHALGAGPADGSVLDLVALARSKGRPTGVVRFNRHRVSEGFGHLNTELLDLIAMDAADVLTAAFQDGLPAVLDAIEAACAVTDSTELGTNWLSLIGGQVSAAARRAVLLFMLRHLNWNMQHVGERLRLGGTQGVLRAIKELGGEVASAYQTAKETGLITAGGRRPRASTKAPVSK